MSPQRPEIHPDWQSPLADPEPALAPTTNSTAFHMTDSMLEARLFFKKHTDDDWTRPSIQTVFPTGDNVYTPDREPYSDQIFLESRSQEIIWHEYGHAIMDNAYGHIPERRPGRYGRSVNLIDSCHSLTTESSYGFAMREGWAEYASGIVGDWINDSRSYHTEESGSCRPFGDADEMDGYRVEGSVASVLYNLTAERNPNNPAAVSFDTLFDVFRTEYPQSIFEVYKPLRSETPNRTAYDQVFLDHGIDIRPPDLQVSGNSTRTIIGPTITLDGTASHRNYNMSRIQYRVVANGTYGGETDGSTDWKTIAGPNETSFESSLLTTAARTVIEVRASNRWDINTTENVVVHRHFQMPRVDGTIPRDPDGDGVYTDLTGDGDSTIADVLAYYNHRKSDHVRGSPDFFDYDGDGTAGTVFDAVALYEKIAA
jgi:hypothetical protein